MIPELPKQRHWKTFLAVAVILGALTVPLYLGFSHVFTDSPRVVTVRVVSTLYAVNTTETFTAYHVETVTTTVTMTNSSG